MDGWHELSLVGSVMVSLGQNAEDGVLGSEVLKALDVDDVMEDAALEDGDALYTGVGVRAWAGRRVGCPNIATGEVLLWAGEDAPDDMCSCDEQSESRKWLG